MVDSLVLADKNTMQGCRPLTDLEVMRVIQRLDGKFNLRDQALFVLGVKTGFRISELLSLKVKDFIQHGQFVTRVRVKRQNMKKKQQSREVPLHPQAKKVLSEWFQKLKSENKFHEEHFVFLSQKGINNPISRRHALRVLRVAYDAAKLQGPLGTHSMRKTFAEKVHRNFDKDLIKTQRALGHKNINSTVSYLSFDEEEIDAGILAS